MAEVSECARCGQEIARISPVHVWRDLATGSRLCEQTPNENVPHEPGVIVGLDPKERLTPPGGLMRAFRELGPLIGQHDSQARGIPQWNESPPAIAEALEVPAGGSATLEDERCQTCGIKLRKINPPPDLLDLEARWIDASGHGATCIGGRIHKPGPPSQDDAKPGTFCRYCSERIRMSPDRQWRRPSLRTTEPQLNFRDCPASPVDGGGHMPPPAVRAELPTNSHGNPTGEPGITLRWPGDKRWTLVPDEAVALMWDMALLLGEGQLRRIARALVDRLLEVTGGELLDEVGWLDQMARYEPVVKLAEDAQRVQLWAGPLMIADMGRVQVAEFIHQMALYAAHMRSIPEEAAG